MGPDFACCRLIFGEADQLPGLTVDRFSDILVTQILSLGMEQRKPLLFRLLVEELEKRGARPRAIYERNDVAIRELEGMEQGKGFVAMEGLETELSGHVEICENGVYYDVDYMEGQKTGFSWIRNTTARRWPGWPRAGGYWIVLPIRAPLPLTRPKAALPR